MTGKGGATRGRTTPAIPTRRSGDRAARGRQSFESLEAHARATRARLRATSKERNTLERTRHAA